MKAALSRKTNTLKKIGIYIRVSTEEQTENPEGSIKSQEQRLRSFVEIRNGSEPFGEIVDVFIDPARSGKDTNRPELQRLLQCIARGEITMVMCTELSRLSRSIKDFCGIWDLMRTHGCEFLSLRENFDTTTAAGEMMMFSIMNFAQFERKQVAERVIANLQSRSARGLYNGGIVPVGYKTVPDKKGYLAIDEETAPTIKKCFEAFLEKDTLTSAAKWLNAEGYGLPKAMQNGGSKPRLGHFTIANLHTILTNKAYAGIKTYHVKGEEKCSKAVWEPIVDHVIFDRVQKLLAKNYCRKKTGIKNRYPFLLAGVLNCGSCGDRLAGKSANGNGGKIPYYEHAWATKKQGCLVTKAFSCRPNRILAKVLEPLIWSEVEALLRNKEVAAQLIESARMNWKKAKGDDQSLRHKERIKTYDSQLEALSERLAVLPKTISPTPIFKQMEKIEKLKADEKEKLGKAESKNRGDDRPADLPTFEMFLDILRAFADDPPIQENKAKIIQRLIHKIEITETGYRIYFYVGQSNVSGELGSPSSPFFCPKSGGNKRAHQSLAAFREPVKNSFLLSGSNSLTNGWGTRIRT